MENICRICMTVSEDLISIVAKENEDLDYNCAYMFEECFNIKLNYFPRFQKICMNCKIQLSYFYKFKQQALKTHSQLEKLGSYESDRSNTVDPADDLCQKYTNGDEDEDYFPVEYLDEELDNFANIKEEIDLDCVSENFGEQVEIYLNELPESVVDCIEEQKINIADVEEEDEGEEQEEYEEGEDGEDEEDKTDKSKSRRWKFRCAPCGKNFRSDKTYTAHMNVHKGLPPYQCNICSKSFKYKVNHEYHMKNHNNDREFKCTICEKSFLCKWDLKLHLRVHANIRPFICEICGKGFRVRSHMTDHKETHNENNTYECPICLQKYKTKVTLKLHLTTIHIKARQYTCCKCGRSFNRKHHLKVHSKTHEKVQKV